MSRAVSPARQRVVLATVAVVTALALSSCAAQADPAAQAPGPDAAGFWLGVWQGIIVPVAWVVSLFNQKVGIYEVRNNGGWYDFGFVIGIGIGAGIGRGLGWAGGKRRSP
ncbi:MAG TPA: hypothetical protein VFK66_06030 [Oryzihumus sp.]|nr:hypothetical protein [Oryzihumus sp.]